jgi:hypothetical protein
VNCTVIQRRLLSAEQPDQPASDVAEHLAQCPSCRAWQRRLVELERHIPLLRVPPSTAKARLLQRLSAGRVAERNGPAIAAPPSWWRSMRTPHAKERAQRKLSLAFALAASLLIFALCWWSWPHRSVPVVDRGMQDQAQLNARLTTVLSEQTPQDRVRRLSALAEKIHGEARRMVDHREDLERLAKFYSDVVGKHLLEQARQLPPEERQAVLKDIADSLVQTESDASRFAAQLETRSPRSAASFHKIALAARNGERDLHALLRG